MENASRSTVANPLQSMMHRFVPLTIVSPSLRSQQTMLRATWRWRKECAVHLTSELSLFRSDVDYSSMSLNTSLGRKCCTNRKYV